MIRSFSAKDLCSQSCKQIRMFQVHPELRTITASQRKHMIDGVSFQSKIASKQDNLIGEEMRGYYTHRDIRIFFCNDIVCKDKIIEVKYIGGSRTVEKWYFESSLLQAALYYSLLLCSENLELVTATFAREERKPERKILFNKEMNYYLHFGNDVYQIHCSSPKKIVSFFTQKASSTSNWNDAKAFDQEFKHKEYQVLKKYFSYTKVNSQ